MAQDSLRVGSSVVALALRQEIHFSGAAIIRIALWSIAGLLTLTLALATIPMIWSWYPVAGRSMEPTLPAIGGFFKVQVEKPCGQLLPGQIVVLRGDTLGYSIKRVARVDPAKGLYVLGDNVDRSKDSSYGIEKGDACKMVFIPFAEVKGRAIDIWSPQRMWRARSAQGRLENVVSFQMPPSSWRKYQDTLVYVCRGKVIVARDARVLHQGRLSSVVPTWNVNKEGKLVYSASPFQSVCVDLVTREVARIDHELYSSARAAELGLDLEKIVVSGDRGDWLGKIVYYPADGDSVPEFRARVTGVVVEGEHADSISILKTEPAPMRAGYPKVVYMEG